MIVDQSKSNLTEGLLSISATQQISVVRSNLTQDDTCPAESSLNVCVWLGVVRELD